MRGRLSGFPDPAVLPEPAGTDTVRVTERLFRLHGRLSLPDPSFSHFRTAGLRPRSPVISSERRDTMKKIIIAAAAFLLAFPAMAGDISCSSVPQLRQQAESGTAKAQAALGDLYYRGRCVRQDYDMAFRWSEKAALQGDSGAEFMMALLYAGGLGTDRNNRISTEWLAKSAVHGNPRAQYAVGNINRGDPVSDVEAKRWYEKAAAQGYDKAQNSLGELYYSEKEVFHDCRKALELFRAAAKQGNSDAEYHLGEMYGSGKCVKRNPKESRRWHRKSASHGNELAKSALAGR